MSEIQVGIHGVPRSGTSWLGQIFNSSPRVAYRFQPLFSYAFKDRIDDDSSPAEIQAFMEDLERTEDPFVLQRVRLSSDPDPGFRKLVNPTHLVVKHVRYHHLIRHLLGVLPGFRVLAVVRHPCATINSWLKTPREFDPAWDPIEEWRFAGRKNRGRQEEYFGFEKWKEFVRLVTALEERWPKRVRVVTYADLNKAPLDMARDLFAYCDLTLDAQTERFIIASTQGHSPDPYSTFKIRAADDAWKTELDPRIASAILTELADDALGGFLTA